MRVPVLDESLPHRGYEKGSRPVEVGVGCVPLDCLLFLDGLLYDPKYIEGIILISDCKLKRF